MLHLLKNRFLPYAFILVDLDKDLHQPEMARNPPDVTLGQHPEIKIDLPKNTAEKKKADLISPPSKASIITIPKDAEEKKKNDLISPPNKASITINLRGHHSISWAVCVWGGGGGG